MCDSSLIIDMLAARIPFRYYMVLCFVSIKWFYFLYFIFNNNKSFFNLHVIYAKKDTHVTVRQFIDPSITQVLNSSPQMANYAIDQYKQFATVAMLDNDT